MPEWLKAILPFAGPLVVAALTAILGAVFSQPRRLRRDIAEDAALLPSLTGVARGLLSEDMHQNAIRLAAWRRYPGLLPWDYFRLFLVIGGVAAQALAAWSFSNEGTRDIYAEDTLSLAIPPVVVTGAYYLFHQSWVWRSKDRNAMLSQHHVNVDPDTAWFWSHYGVLTSALIGMCVMVAPPTITAIAASNAFDWPKWATLLIAGVAAVCLMIALWVLVRVEDSTGRPLPQTERQRREAEEIARSRVMATAIRLRRKELGLRWYSRLPRDERERITAASESGAGSVATKTTSEE